MPEIIFLVPFLLAIGVILLAWFLYIIRASKRDVRKQKANLFRCESCGRVYSDTRTLPLVRCPVCGKTNQALKR